MSVLRKCRNCGGSFFAKAADVKRGWARFCSKSCKAQKQTRDTGCAGPLREGCGNFIQGAAEDGK
jgi:hypothetical protein